MERWSSYIVAVPELWERLAAGGAPLPHYRYDSRRAESAPFIEALRCFDQLVYAPLGMRMPHWVLYDCAVIPGLVFGLAAPADQVTGRIIESLALPAGYRGPVPLSMLIAVPEIALQGWLVYEVLGIDRALPGEAELGLCQRTLAEALALLGSQRITTTLQWGSAELAIHTAHAPLEVLAAWLPAHDQPGTAVLRYRPGGASPPQPTDELDVGDPGQLRLLQQVVEAGDRVWITGPPRGDRVPYAVERGG